MHKVFAKLGLGAILMVSGTVYGRVAWEEPPPFNVHVWGGYQQAQLKWSIQGNQLLTTTSTDSSGNTETETTGFPNPYAKVKYEGLRLATVGASFDYSSVCNYYCRGGIDYGRVMKGNSRVSLYSSNDPNVEFSRIKADCGRGYVMDTNFGVGYKFISGGGRCWVAGVGGYSYHTQDLKQFHNDLIIDTEDFIGTGEILGLSTGYRTRWYGPWLGIDFSTMLECCVTIFGSGEWHWAQMRGRGTYNLHDDYRASYRQKANGYGVVATLGIDYIIANNWSLGLIGNYQQWSTKGGRNESDVKFDNLASFDETPDTFPLVPSSKLNRVRWTTVSVSVLASYRY